MTTRLPRLLLSAYSCDPAQGSEPTVGWNRAVEAARHGQAWVLTEAAGQEDRIRREIERQGLGDRLRFHFLPHTPTERWLMRIPGGYYLGYNRWQRRAFRLARRLHRDLAFDLVHHVNLVGYREPGYLHRLGVPFVLGPMGGTQNYPRPFLTRAGWGEAVREGTRSLVNAAQLRFSPRVREAAQAASAVVVANSTGQRDLQEALGVEPIQLLETGVRDVGSPRRWADRTPGPLRVLWVGEARYRKGIDLMLEAHRHLRRTGHAVELTVVGDGPHGHLVGSDPDVDWQGWLPYRDALGSYAEADVFVFTSLRDTSGNVVLEALANGLPVVYLDHQGARDMVTPACGVPVAVTTPRRAVRDLAAGILHVGADPERYDRMSEAAIDRARALSWRHNGAAMWRIYDDVLRRAGAPTRAAALSAWLCEVFSLAPAV